MADEKTIVVSFGVPESVYGALQDLAAAKNIRLDQLCTIAVGAGLKSVMKLPGRKKHGTD